MRALIVIAASWLCFGCFALDEIDAGQKEMDRYTAKGKSDGAKPADAGSKGKAEGEQATPEERAKQWWSSARTFSPREDDAKSDIVRCKVGGTVRFTSQADCTNSGGRSAGS
jgi:hypothetical protein